MRANGVEDAPFVDAAEVFPWVGGPFEVYAGDVEDQGEECPWRDADGQLREARGQMSEVGCRRKKPKAGRWAKHEDWSLAFHFRLLRASVP